MAKGTPEKIARNKKIVELKAKMSFSNLARMFNLSDTRVKAIYYTYKKKNRKG